MVGDRVAPRFADVALAGPAGPSGGVFTYAIPLELTVEVGHVVWVPFGEQRRQGVVVGQAARTEVPSVRPILGLADATPTLLPYQVELARWLAATYAGTLGDAAFLMVPPGIRQSARTELRLNPAAEPARPLTPIEEGVVDYLASHGPANPAALRRAVPRAGGATGALVRLGVVERSFRVPAPRVDAGGVRLTDAGRGAAIDDRLAARAPRQWEALDFMRERADAGAPVVPVEDLRRELGVALAFVRSLAARGWIALGEPVPRPPGPGRPPGGHRPDGPGLNAEQARALDEILAAPAGSAHLLRGVTGSGKTDVYLRLVEDALARGAGAIVLVPEIGLTPQAVHRFGARFPGRVVVVHSRLSVGERLEAWRRARRGDARVVVGPRAALFAPVANLGAIVVDEEHEGSYKHEWHPRYHAREAAIALGRLCGARVVLGSATPDVVTIERARSGELASHLLTARATGASLPAVTVVDMRQVLREGHTGLISPTLATELHATLARREQAVLFLNRRGAATVVMCRDCGHAVMCRRCDVAMVYHADRELMLCHQCSRRQAAPELCPGCRGRRIRHFGAGTQRVEREVAALVPNSRVARWDADVVRRPEDAAALLRRLAAFEVDVLVGTQSVARGLDVPRVTLVGAVSADTALYLPDFRAAERTFQLLTQVAGRAGRGALPGRVVVQSYRPDHYCVARAANHDVDGFAADELAFRRAHRYPPFARLARVVYASASETRAEAEARRRARRLAERARQLGLPGVELIGPAPCYRRHPGGRWRWQILIRADDPAPLLSDLDWPLGWSIDVDPASTL